MKSFYRLANLLLDQGMTLEAFNELCLVLFDLVRGDTRSVQAAYGAEAALIDRTRVVEYPHGKRVEWEDGKRYEV